MSIVATSCEKAPFLTLSTPKTINFTDQGGTQSITFTANRSWSVSSSDSWCKVSPSSGENTDGNITVTLTCEQNTTYDSRSATLTVRVEELSETITITQDTNLGLLVSPTSYDLTNAAQSIEVEVRANVKYSVEIDAACKDWITQTGTKALSTEKITFSIAANESYDNREGKITIKQTDGSLSETIVVKQSQTNGLFITTPEYDLSNEEHTLSVEVKANVSFQVSPQVDWIKYVETKALTSSTIVLSIEANATYDDRTGTVLVKQTNGDLSGTITINQKQTDGLFVTPTDVDVDNAEHTVELEVRNNVSYNVVIPDEAKEWISIKSNTATKALAENKVTLAIAQNATYDNREASITIKQTDGPLAETVKIKQAQTDGLIIGTKEYEVGRDGETIVIQLQTNVEYDVIIPEDAKEWVARVESAPTKALVNESVYLQIAENPTYFNRETSVVIKKKGADLQETVSIKQAQTDALFISDESKEYRVPSKGGEIVVNVFHNIDFEIDATSIPEWITISKTDVDTYNSKLSLTVSQNNEYVGRDTEVKMVGGALSDVATISQHQVDIVLADIVTHEASWMEGEFTVRISRNVDYAIDFTEWIDKCLQSTEIDGNLYSDIYLFSVERNLDEERTGYITLIWNNEGVEIKNSIKIKQECCTIYLNEAGSLKDYFSADELSKVKVLILSGSINGTDFIIINRMSALARLDLLKARIVEGGLPYRDQAYTTNSTAFGDYFYLNKAIKHIVLPEYIESIDGNGFRQTNVETIVFPNGLKSVGWCCFASSAIRELNFPEGFEYFDYQSFFGCHNLKEVTLPASVQHIEGDAFGYCTGLKTVRIKALPSTLTYIGSNAFSHSYDNATLFIPQGTYDAYYLTDLGRFTRIIEE